MTNFRRFFSKSMGRKGCRFRRALRLLGFLVIILFAPTGLLLGHGGGLLQVANADTGPYRTSIWTSPPAIRGGQPLHITVAVADAENGEPVLDALVKVQLRPLGSEAALLSAEATTAQSANKLFYEADIDGLRAGAYEVMVTVAGQAGGGQVAFMLDVEQGGASRWIARVLFAVVLLTPLLLWRSWRRRSGRLN